MLVNWEYGLKLKSKNETVEECFVGNPNYAAPEIFKSWEIYEEKEKIEKVNYDPIIADIYSLGSLLLLFVLINKM